LLYPSDDISNSEIKEALAKVAAVVYKSSSPESIIAELKTKGEKAQAENKQTKDKYISVSKFISAVHAIGNSIFRLTPEFNQVKRKQEYIEANRHNPAFNGDVEAIGKSFDEQVALEE
jgi:hypothetical protein